MIARLTAGAMVSCPVVDHVVFHSPLLYSSSSIEYVLHRFPYQYRNTSDKNLRNELI